LRDLAKCPFEIIFINQPPMADFGDFAKQRNGGGDRQKDLFTGIQQK
jgi:hypothetical protein